MSGTERIIPMPKLGMTMTEGVMVAWHVAVGDIVKRDDVLAEVDTDKVTLEVESPVAGRVTRLLTDVGATIPVGDPIIVLEVEAPATVRVPEPLPVATAVPLNAQNAAAQPLAAQANRHSATTATQPPSPLPTTTEGRTPSTPAARRIAATHGIDIAIVAQQLGKTDPIRSADVLAFVGTAPSPQTSAALPPAPAQADTLTSESLLPLTTMRRTIAERTTHSFTTTPHIYLDTLVDLWRIEAARTTQTTAFSPTIFLLKAVAVALRQHPALNAGFVAANNGSPAMVRRWHDVHIGVAVAVPDGLLVPIIRHANTKTLAQLATELQQVAARTRAGKLTPDDLTGGTFSISNLGMYGIDTFHAVINAPQAAILAVGRVTRTPVVIADGAGGETVGIRPLLKLSLSADHRVVDGATGAQFLATLRSLLEDPASLAE